MKIKDIFIALLVPIILGFGFAIAKPAMQYFPPYLLMGLRFTIPALMLVWWSVSYTHLTLPTILLV